MVVGKRLIDKNDEIFFEFFLDSNNETKSFLLVDELHLINKNLNTLGQLLKQRTTRLLQTGLPTSNDDLLLLYQEHKVSFNLLYEGKKVIRWKHRSAVFDV
jgi:hypothetical protein